MKWRIALGAALWALILTTLAVLASGAELGPRGARLFRFLFSAPHRYKVELPANEAMLPGDRVLQRIPSGWRVIGQVESVQSESAASVNGATRVGIVIDPELASLAVDAELRLIDARGDLGWAFQALLPPERLERIRSELSTFQAENHEELIALAQISGKAFVDESITNLNARLSDSVKKHEKEWRAVLDNHRKALKEKVLPVLKAELGPVVKERLKPVLTKVGRELWDELPLWTVTWRSLADQIPYVARQKYMDSWWQEFLDTKAIPIVKAHEAEFISLAEDLLIKGAENEKVREALADAARRIVDDPEFRKLMNSILNETLVEPFDSKAFFERLLALPEFRERFDLLSSRFGPVAERIGRLFLDADGGPGINPELVQVARRIFFEKRKRALLILQPPPELARVSAPQGHSFTARNFVGQKVSLLPGVSGTRKGDF